MNPSQLLLYRAARSALSTLPVYVEATRQFETFWSSFTAAQPPELWEQALELIDLANIQSSIETERLFFLGLQLGLELRDGERVLPDEG